MVNFYDGFLDPSKAAVALKERQVEKELRQQLPNDPKRIETEIKQWHTTHSPGPTPLSVLIDHIDHIAKVAGIDHVGLGSDFDGVPSLPTGLEDISNLPNITFELLKRGYTETYVRKVLGENLLRVMSDVERTAAVIQGTTAPK
jgi:membrane dipeptidase